MTNRYWKIVMPALGARLQRRGVTNRCAVVCWYRTIRFRHFKVVLVWNDPFQKSSEAKRIGPFDALIIKVRVHGLAHAREVFIEDEPDGGFLDIGQARDVAAVDEAVARRFAATERFSDDLAQHARLATA
jgi:hypothetical protein